MTQEKIGPWILHRFLNPHFNDPALVEYADGRVDVIEYAGCPADVIWAVRRTDLIKKCIIPVDENGVPLNENDSTCTKLRTLLNGPQRDSYNCLKRL